MPSDSRRPYTALTPNQADFALQQSAESSTSVSTFLSPNDPHSKRTSIFLSRLREFVAVNAGLLLVTAAQAVFSCKNTSKLIQKVEHPFIGPQGVRTLLIFRGVTGFIGLNGTYFSLQYLSLSDFTVLSFLVPMSTAIAGSLFLKEVFTKREALAGLCSLFGVVLIARPDFLFGTPKGSSEVEEKHRMLAIGIALSGVLGSTGAMTSIRAIGQRARHGPAGRSLDTYVSLVNYRPTVFPANDLPFAQRMRVRNVPHRYTGTGSTNKWAESRNRACRSLDMNTRHRKMLVHQGEAGNGVLKFNGRYYADRMLKGSSTGKTKKYELEVPLTSPSTDGSWFHHLMLYIRSHTPP
ncbi:hypothetical protein B0H16DRAFT_1474627 [Mycena metata]|uniref:EamA domain-containing protein n=1 Tax=Mycena metata TaxID=1033252 RepID=A0AAD7HFX2_9AGAR|nr:hypothetical protein B0H16DRAFT_1474627 [Mycena metata]